MSTDYRLCSEAANKSTETVAVYLSAFDRFAEWLEAGVARPRWETSPAKTAPVS
jgi:hypothetical protein